jgi:hypothetical protein
MKIVFLLLPFLVLSCCNGSRSVTTTPKEYQYRSQIAKGKYQSDTAIIRSILIKMIDNEIKPFDRKTYDKETDLFIDSMVYSPDQLRMIVFVVAKNSTMKLLRRENDLMFYYDALYLFCSRESMNAPIKVYDYSGYHLDFFYNYSEISEALREYCFNRLMRNEGAEQYYNVNDIRFWSSKYFERVLNNSTPTSE